MTPTPPVPAVREAVAAALGEHNGVNLTAGWEGSPDSTNPRNIRRVCKCGAVIGWHDRSRQRSGHSYPISGYPFDEPHRAHVAEVIADTIPAIATALGIRVATNTATEGK